jgi:hypothetical protein
MPLGGRDLFRALAKKQTPADLNKIALVDGMEEEHAARGDRPPQRSLIRGVQAAVYSISQTRRSRSVPVFARLGERVLWMERF